MQYSSDTDKFHEQDSVFGPDDVMHKGKNSSEDKAKTGSKIFQE
jgi:hypothetical protein